MKRFNRDDRASIAHALMHLKTNKIADDDYPGHSGWYCGNREQFVKRHKKAVALMRSLLTPNMTGKASLDPLVGRKLAIRIARSIFTPTGGRHKRVSRIALMRDGKDLCGWGFWEAVEQIRKILVRANTALTGGQPPKGGSPC